MAGPKVSITKRFHCIGKALAILHVWQALQHWWCMPEALLVRLLCLAFRLQAFSCLRTVSTWHNHIRPHKAGMWNITTMWTHTFLSKRIWTIWPRTHYTSKYLIHCQRECYYYRNACLAVKENLNHLTKGTLHRAWEYERWPHYRCSNYSHSFTVSTDTCHNLWNLAI